jgi:hypothetical protein
MNKKKIGERGSISLFMVFVSLSIVLLVLYSLIFPLLQQMNISFFESSESLLIDANATAAKISNPGIRSQLQATLQAEVDSVATQVDILGVFFQYGWIILILVVVLVLFMWSRQLVETQIA